MKRFLCLLFVFISFSLNAFQNKLELANLSKEAGLFDSSISLYLEILRNVDDDCKEMENIYFSLAECYFQNENFIKTIEVLKCKCDTENKLLLLAMSYNRLKQYDEAIYILSSYPDLLNTDEAIYERAFALFYSNRLQEAKIEFERLVNAPQDLLFLSKLYLARICLHFSSLEEAEILLSGMENALQGHPLQKELYYLQGQLYFQKRNYILAIEAFEKVTSKTNSLQSDVLYQLGWSYLKAIDDPLNVPHFKRKLFEKAEAAFKKMDEDESLYLSLSACYLSRAHILKDEEASHFFESDHLYRELTANKNEESLFYSKTLYLKGLNDIEEGKKLLSLKKETEAHSLFERAAYFLAEAALRFKKENKKLAGLSLKSQAGAFAEENQESGFLKAFHIYDTLIEKNPEIFSELEDPDEIYYLRALSLLKLLEKETALESKKKYFPLIEGSLKINLTLYPKGKFADLSLILLGTFYYQNKRYEEAASRFLQIEKTSKPELICEAYFYAALALDQSPDKEEIARELRKKIYTEYPLSKYAAESYFLYYSYQDYVQGDRAALKHLHSFTEIFKESVFLLNAHYLIGMDYERDRKTAEGKWIRKKSLTSAVDHFQLVISTFDRLEKASSIQDQLDYFVSIRYNALLEKGIAYLKIAEESSGTKSEIYLEYAQNVFSQIVQDFKSPQSCFAKFIVDKEPYPSLLEESSYYLGISYIKLKNFLAARKVYDEMIENYQSLNITRSYYLSRIFYELGLMLMNEKEYGLSLGKLQQAEDAAKGKILNSDQKLDLWIQMSLCYLGLKQYDSAILILSKVINSDVVSSLRLKAMFLRAEMYEYQGRFDLCKKQLEAVAKNGGDWAVKAHERLDNIKGE